MSIVVVVFILGRAGVLTHVSPIIVNVFVAALPGLFFVFRGKVLIGAFVSVVYYLGRLIEFAIPAEQTIPRIIIGPLALFVGYKLGELATRWFKSTRSQ
ncbi:MAG: hypothetical protein HC853_18995 [Anaerolineae bacterium]|nr:hypothetical protein [Anaerolineae bacterium]